MKEKLDLAIRTLREFEVDNGMRKMRMIEQKSPYRGVIDRAPSPRITTDGRGWIRTYHAERLKEMERDLDGQNDTADHLKNYQLYLAMKKAVDEPHEQFKKNVLKAWEDLKKFRKAKLGMKGRK